MWNTLLTAIGIGYYAVYEQDVDVTNPATQSILPFLYRHTKNNEVFTVRRFLSWLMMGMVHSVVVYYVPIIIYRLQIVNKSGHVDLF